MDRHVVKNVNFEHHATSHYLPYDSRETWRIFHLQWRNPTEKFALLLEEYRETNRAIEAWIDAKEALELLDQAIKEVNNARGISNPRNKGNY